MDAETEIISDLKFISQIKKNEKINTQFMYVQKDGLFTRISRTFINPDNRYNTLNFLQRTISNSIKILDEYDRKQSLGQVSKTENLRYNNIIKDLMNARIGLLNIQETYKTDLKFRCDITTLVEIIENKFPVVIPRDLEERKERKESVENFDEDVCIYKNKEETDED